MSRKKKSSSKSPPRRVRVGEDRGSVALTVAWMLTALMTGLAVVVVIAGQLLLWQSPPQSADAQPLAFVPGLFLLVATVTAVLCLMLTPVVYRVRRDPPPRSIATTVVAVCLLPLAIVAWRTLFA